MRVDRGEDISGGRYVGKNASTTIWVINDSEKISDKIISQDEYLQIVV